MVKHNNILPNQHYHKVWAGNHCVVPHGIRPRVNFNQPARKHMRRLARKAKAAAIAPRPLARFLRPVVHCQTAKYKSKVRTGRGFTLEELKEAGIPKKLAPTIGIAVDHRRTNLSVEGLQANVQRLKAYKSKLIVFPRKSNNKPKNGDSSAAETSTATQLTGTIMPVSNDQTIETTAITGEMKSYSAYRTVRIEKSVARNVGKLEVRKKMLAARKAEKSSKKKKN